MQIVGNELRLQCTGTDSGIAIDRIASEIPSGPYELHFRVNSDSQGGSEVYFTIDRKTKLPNGQRLAFDIVHDGQWYDQTLELNTDQQLQALRLDIGDQPGKVVIVDLRLTDRDGQTILRWPSVD